MSDSYQAIYDAVRSRISGGNIGDAVERCAREAFDMGYTRDIIQQEFVSAAYEMQRPSAIYRPALAPDGDHWCALYGENLVEGLAAFGKTPDEAMRAFDKAWAEQQTPAACRSTLANPDPQP